MAEPLLIAVVAVAGFTVVALMNAHGKARAFEQGTDPTVKRNRDHRESDPR
jgi:hypothetical protein